MSSTPLADHPARAHPLLGIAYKVVGTILLSAMGALVKHMSTGYPVSEIVFFRSLFALAPVVVLMLASKERFGLLRTRHPWAHVRRSVIGCISLATAFLTIRLLPFADATALSFSAPLFVVIFAIPLLGERIGIYRLSAVFIGFIGMLMIAQPHVAGGPDVSGGSVGVAVGIMSAILISLAQITVRFASRTERALTTVFYFSAASTLMSAMFLPFDWQTPGLADFVLLTLIGLLGGVAQIAFTQSYRYADASTLAPFDYASLIWALILGLIFFGEFPQPMVIAGALVVVTSGLIIVFRERYLARQRRRVLAGSVNI